MKKVKASNSKKENINNFELTIQEEDKLKKYKSGSNLSISNDNLFYLYWKEGRLYFFVDNEKNRDDNIIHDIIFDALNNSMRFRWIGEWDNFTEGIKNVNHLYTLKFKKIEDFNKIKLKFENN